MNKHFKRLASFGRALPAAGVVGALMVLASAPARALPVDLTALTAAVDFSTAETAILAVAGVLITVYIAIKATGFVLGQVKRG